MPGTVDRVRGARDIRVHRPVRGVRVNIPRHHRLEPERIDDGHGDAVEGRGVIRQVLRDLEGAARDAGYRPVVRLRDFETVEGLREAAAVEVHLPRVITGGKRAVLRIGGRAAERDGLPAAVGGVDHRCCDRRAGRRTPDDDLDRCRGVPGSVVHRERRGVGPSRRVDVRWIRARVYGRAIAKVPGVRERQSVGIAGARRRELYRQRRQPGIRAGRKRRGRREGASRVNFRKGIVKDAHKVQVAIGPLLQVRNRPGSVVEDGIGDLGRKGGIERDRLDILAVVVAEEHGVIVLFGEDRTRVPGDCRGGPIIGQVAVGVGGVDVAAAAAIALIEVPPVVPTGLDGIQFLPVARSGILRDGFSIGQERKAERVAQAVGVDRRNGPGDVQERVVAGDRPIKPEAQNLAVDVVEGLRVADVGDVVTHRPPQFPIRADMQIVRAVVGVLQLVALHVDDFAREVQGPALYREPGELGVFVHSRVGHVDVPVGGVVRVDGEAEQAFLVRTVGVDRPKRRRQNRAIPVDQDRTGLFAYKNIPGGREGKDDRVLQAARELLLREAR